MSTINKIHINNTTKISLNDRFTVMQSVGPKSPLPQKSPRRRTQSASSQDRNVPKASVANRKFLEQLDKKHKMQAALKLKRRSMKPQLPSRQRIRNRIGIKKGAIGLRLARNGKISRSNSLSNIATMKADIVQPALRRSNSTSSLAGRLGTRRADSSGGQTPRRRLNRNAIVRASSRQNLTRSNSTASLKRSNSRSNLKRSNSKNDLNRGGQRNLPQRGLESLSQRRRIVRKPFQAANGKQQQSVRRSSSVSSRLGVKRVPMVRDRIRDANIRSRPGRGGVAPGRNGAAQGRSGFAQGRSSGVAQGRIFKRRNSTATLTNTPKSGARRGRISRPRGRGNTTAQRGRSRSKIRTGNSETRLGRNNSMNNKGNRSSSRGRGRGIARGRGGRGRGITRASAPKQDIKKEDLDKELDQYMSTTRIGMDKDMDVFMSNSF